MEKSEVTSDTETDKPAEGTTPVTPTDGSPSTVAAASESAPAQAEQPKPAAAPEASPAAPAPNVEAAAQEVVAVAKSEVQAVVAEDKAKAAGFLDQLTAHIKTAEKAGNAEVHAAAVGLHAHLAELKNKLDLLGHKLSDEAKHIVEHLRSIL